jgi:N-acetyl-anhydromuramyl-L-alanine amidase AmpD
LLGDTLLLRPVLPRAFRAPAASPGIPDLEEQVPGPDSPVADRFVQANAVRFCTPGQANSATCANLPTPRPIRQVVIHVLAVPSSARRSGAEAVVAGWQNADRQAASHYIVDRDGTITQMVRESDVAFHTPGNNADSIGIEHADVCNDPSPLTDRLYARSAQLVRDIASRNNFVIDQNTVRGHSQVNPNHGDPGPYWDWEFYFQWLAWSGQIVDRPCRRVAAAAALPGAPAGWQVHRRRAIPDDHCAGGHDPWGANYFTAAACDAIRTSAEVSLILEEAGTYSVSLWWPLVDGAAAAAQVDVEVACLQSPCVGTSLQTVTVDQRSGAGRWNFAASVNVTRSPSELKVRWHCPTAGGAVIADAVRALKIAPPPQLVPRLNPENFAEVAPLAAPRSACAYFFKGGNYLRYGIGTDTVDFAPVPIASQWHLPPAFQSDLDAAVNWGNGKVYFFKGPNYLRYNIATDRVDVPPTPIYPAWPTLPPKFRDGVHAAVNWGNGKVYFFKDGDYVRYDIASDAVDVGPTAIASGWPALPAAFQSNLDAAVNWGNGKVYFFKGTDYVRYDIAQDRPDFAPMAIAQGWPALPAAFQRDLQTAVNWTDPCDLAALFASMSVSVVEEPGWRSAGRPGVFAPVGIVMHHTGGNHDLAVVVNGRGPGSPGGALPGPLAHFYVARSGEVHLVAAGKANHAGPGAREVLQDVLSSVAPSGTAAARGLHDSVGGNEHFYGFECENKGDGVQDWPAVQLDAMARAAAALCQRHCWSVDRIISHAEWTSRKPDPRGISMSDFRQMVASFF